MCMSMSMFIFIYMNMDIDTDPDLDMDMEMYIDTQRFRSQISGKIQSDILTIYHGLCHLQFNVRGKDIWFNPISLITDIRLSVQLRFLVFWIGTRTIANVLF
jgi:hypothetical protein